MFYDIVYMGKLDVVHQALEDEALVVDLNIEARSLHITLNRYVTLDGAKVFLSEVMDDLNLSGEKFVIKFVPCSEKQHKDLSRLGGVKVVVRSSN